MNAQEIHAQIFSPGIGREVRSAAYRLGALNALHNQLEGTRKGCPYEPGSPERDAYFAGRTEGLAVAREHRGAAA